MMINYSKKLKLMKSHSLWSWAFKPEPKGIKT